MTPRQMLVEQELPSPEKRPGLQGNPCLNEVFGYDLSAEEADPIIHIYWLGEYFGFDTEITADLLESNELENKVGAL